MIETQEQYLIVKDQLMKIRNQLKFEQDQTKNEDPAFIKACTEPYKELIEELSGEIKKFEESATIKLSS